MNKPTDQSMNQPMKKTISDEQLILLYYGEHDDPQLAAVVAASPELSARLQALGDALAVLDQVPVAGEESFDVHALWMKLQPHLVAEPSHHRAASKRWRQWLNALRQPRLSLAGLASVLAVAALAFWLGGRHVTAPSPLMAGDAWRGAALEVFLVQHLNESERWLTHAANRSAGQTLEHQGSVGDVLDPVWTESLLHRNRLYRITAANTGQQMVAQVLSDFESVLLQTANQPVATARVVNPQPQIERVLFRVRVLNRQVFRVRVLNRQAAARHTPTRGKDHVDQTI